MYNVSSDDPLEFINHEEILDTLFHATINKDNNEEICRILDKAKKYQGLTHREATILLECDDPQVIDEIYHLAAEIKSKFYGNRIVLFAPLYISNYCINSCLYCPYHKENEHIQRRKLSQEDIKKEVIALQNMGHKRIALETGEHPIEAPIEYVLESLKTIYSTTHKNGAIRRVNVNIAATTVENYKKLKEAGIGTYILFQETYNKENYDYLHPKGPKSDYRYHTTAMDRAMTAGIDDVGIGVLFGLNSYQYDFIGLLIHKEHLEAKFNCGPHTISVPRVRPADSVDPNEFDNGLSDEMFKKIVALIRITVPYTGIIISTREAANVRKDLLRLGVSQISGGSKTSVGGYHKDEISSKDTEQFQTNDNRTLDEIIFELLSDGFIPSFCTACYRKGRTGEHFMDMIKAGDIAPRCHKNALLTMKEYLLDYASTFTKINGDRVIREELIKIEDTKTKEELINKLLAIGQGNRDIRY